MLDASLLSIRGLRGTDADFVFALSQQAFGEFSREPSRSTLWMAEHFLTLVAERQGERQGFVVVRLERDALSELAAIAVVERERGRGVGRALLAAATRRARAAGARGSSLHTAEANLAALELFTRAGFGIERRLPRFYVGVFDAWEMVKEF